jgi:tRNA-modifying protein YgfZ
MLQHDPKIAAEVAAARANCVTAGLPHLGMLLLTGSDAARFLHGQCTQEVKAKRPGEGGYAFLLDARGRNLGDFRFVVLDDGIRLILDRDRLEATARHLEKFVIAADVRIAAAGEAPTLVLGPAAGRAFASAAPPSEDHAAVIDGALVVAEPGYGAPGFQVWGLAPVLNAPVIGPAALEVLRIEAGRPRFGVDLDETVLPEESGQGDRAVSYTKGCYSGQEVVAKQKYLGKPRKALVGVLPDADLDLPAVLAGDAGRITSCVWSPTLGRRIGLAMVKTGAASPDGQVATVSGVRATIAALPFVPPTS